MINLSVLAYLVIQFCDCEYRLRLFNNVAVYIRNTGFPETNMNQFHSFQSRLVDLKIFSASHERNPSKFSAMTVKSVRSPVGQGSSGHAATGSVIGSKASATGLKALMPSRDAA